jgi:AmmeMemoRadiSam system protein B/AmmeMemoRadiSam system protein A
MHKYRMISYITLFIALCASGACMGQKKNDVRPAGVAGSFYPDSPAQLKSMLTDLFSRVTKQHDRGQIIGLISPHAGYIYSGHVAAYSYSLLRGKNIKRVVIISPSHTVAFAGASIYNGSAYETPLGLVQVDTEFAQKLSQENDLLQLSDIGHRVGVGGRSEHALEVQLPFLQYTLHEFKIIPIVMGDQSYTTCRALGQALAKLITDDKTVIIASSDLSHFHDYDEAVGLDHKLINAVEEWDYYNICRNCNARIWEACGAGPIAATMIAAEKLGATTASLLKYANSGDIPEGDKSRVVGYAAISFTCDQKSEEIKTENFSLDKEEQKELLSIARHSVETAVREGKVYQCSAGQHESLARDRGAFVTLREHGNLRGCIGFTAPIQPLCYSVRDAAMSAALRDPRFAPVSEDELDQITYEISVLSPLRHVQDVNEISVGKHGLLVKRGNIEGLLLPQVAVDYNWDVPTFLQQTCKKAGLPADAWQNDETDVFLFSAFVFSED